MDLEGAAQILIQINQILTLYLCTKDSHSTSPLKFLTYFFKVTSFIQFCRINAHSPGSFQLSNKLLYYSDQNNWSLNTAPEDNTYTEWDLISPLIVILLRLLPTKPFG